MNETLKSFTALIISVITVHLIYIGYVRPEANQLIEIALLQKESAPRDIVILIKDYEQQICFTLLLWGSFLIADAIRKILKTKYIYAVDLIEDATVEHDETSNAKHDLDVNGIIDRLDKEVPEECRQAPLVHILRSALWRYSATDNVQNLSDSIESNLEALAVKQDSENTMIRYIIWAIPSFGFIGTVRGIGQALSQADEALAGNISGITDSLGIAFNSTLIALLISIFLMFLFHQLQRIQDSQIVDTQDYCDKYLLRRIR